MTALVVFLIVVVGVATAAVSFGSPRRAPHSPFRRADDGGAGWSGGWSGGGDGGWSSGGDGGGCGGGDGGGGGC
ncbi:hypothetical protein [Kineococcus glutinatus]|uniref:Uncharacterized protein n=1 Tax=Kineococcus glutinatus TaxID=1070872 RepID=A0ABP9HY24_9ACTN